MMPGRCAAHRTPEEIVHLGYVGKGSSVRRQERKSGHASKAIGDEDVHVFSTMTLARWTMPWQSPMTMTTTTGTYPTQSIPRHFLRLSRCRRAKNGSIQRTSLYCIARAIGKKFLMEVWATYMSPGTDAAMFVPLPLFPAWLVGAKLGSNLHCVVPKYGSSRPWTRTQDSSFGLFNLNECYPYDRRV